MSGYNASVCSDEELLEELKKLGYDDVSPELFDIMKEDLADLVEKKQTPVPPLDCDSDKECLYSSALSHDSPEAFSIYRTSVESEKTPEISLSRKTRSKSKREKTYSFRDRNINRSVSSEDGNYYNTESEIKSNFNSSFEDGREFSDESSKDRNVSKSKANNNYRKLKNLKDVNSNDETKYSSNTARSILAEDNDLQSDYYLTKSRIPMSHISRSRHRNNFTDDKELSSNFLKKHGLYDETSSEIASDDTLSKGVADAYKFKNESRKMNEYSSPRKSRNLSMSESSTLGEKKTIKRKVLRRRNGRSVITEEIVEIPSIFDTSYPDSDTFNNSKSFSSDDLSCKSNSSTGSVNIVSPESSIKSSPSTFSLLTTRSTSLRVPNSRKKKSDPVAMYNYYKKFWDNFKPPGEKTHDRLRWAVRDKMLDYDL